MKESMTNGHGTVYGSYVILICRMDGHTESDSLKESELLPFVASLTHKILHSLTICD
jgi:hypothetical protein